MGLLAESGADLTIQNSAGEMPLTNANPEGKDQLQHEQQIEQQIEHWQYQDRRKPERWFDFSKDECFILAGALLSGHAEAHLQVMDRTGYWTVDMKKFLRSDNMFLANSDSKRSLAVRRRGAPPKNISVIWQWEKREEKGESSKWVNEWVNFDSRAYFDLSRGQQIDENVFGRKVDLEEYTWSQRGRVGGAIRSPFFL